MNNSLINNNLLNIGKNIIFFIITFFVIWGSYLPGISVFGIVTLFPLRVVLFIWILICFFKGDFKKLYSKNFSLPLISFILIGVIGLIWSQSKVKSMAKLFIYATDIVTFFLAKSMIRTKKDYTDFSFILRLNVYIIFIIALYESVTGNYIYEMSYKWMSFTRNIFGLYEPQVIFYNVNNLASFFVLLFPISFDGMFEQKRHFILKILYILLSIFSILLTGSRGALLGIIFSIISYYLIKLFASKGNLKMKYRAIILAFVIIVLSFAPKIYSIITESGNIKSIRDENRWQIWITLFDICKQYYFMGAGLGTTSTIYFSAHNTILELLFEVGFIGLVSFLVFFYRLFRGKGLPSEKKAVYYSFVLPFIICSIVQSSSLSQYYLWLMWGIWAQYRDIKEKDKDVH